VVGEIDGLEVTGYPRATWDTENTARDYRVRGRLRIETVDWPYAFSVPIAEVPKNVGKWKGMSGAVVVGKESPSRMRIFGAVESVEEMFKFGKLYVARIEAAFNDPLFRDALEEASGEKAPLVPIQIPTLDALAPDLVAMSHYVKEVYERACAEGAMPLDFEAEVSTEGSLRFSPRNPRLPFVGRKNEIAALDRFLAADKHFVWWLVAAAGGAGKTRLARQLCLRAHAKGWRAGFLPNGFTADISALDNWRPEFPTLIVADYTLKRVAEVRKLAARLGRRSGAGLPPVRLLLVEREAGEAFKYAFYGSDQSDRSVILASRYAEEPISVCELSDDELWLFVRQCPWRQKRKRLGVDRTEFLKKFVKLDGQRRVLVAMILADAIAAGAERSGFEGVEEELRDLLRRDRDHLWPAELGVAGRQIGDTDADVAIAFATMIDGLGLQELQAIKEKGGQALNPKILSFCGQAIGKPIKDTPILGRLEPDLIGEFFALEALSADRYNPFAVPPHGWMPETAWQARGGAMADFVRRARQNFPRHPAIRKVAITVKGVSDSWELAARDALYRNYVYYDPRPGLRAASKILLGPAQSDVAAAGTFASLTHWVAWLDPQVIDASTVAELLGELRKLNKKHRGEPALRREWAQAVAAFVDRQANPYAFLEHGQSPNITYPDIMRVERFCLRQLNELAELHEKLGQEPALREAWAAGVRSFINRVAAYNPVPCRTLLRKLAQVQTANPGEAVLREKWADSIVTLVLDRAQKEPADSRALLDELAILHRKHRNEPTLRESWASGVLNFVRHCAAGEPIACRALLDELAGLHKHYNEPSLRKTWARGVTNFMYHRADMDPAGRLVCSTLLGELEQLYRAHLDEPVLREEWAWSVGNFVFGGACDSPADCRRLLDQLATLAAEHPGQPPLRQHWARGIANFVRHRAAEEPVVCRALADDLAGLCAAHPDEAALRRELERAQKAVPNRNRHLPPPRSWTCTKSNNAQG
jgi:DNA polymerase III epsilon subunit-like protein